MLSGWRCALLGCLVAAPAAAKPVKSQGQVGIEARAFTPDGDDRTEDQGFGLAARLEASHKPRPFEEQLRLFARADMLDETRAVAVVEEAFVGWQMNPVRLRVGYQLLNWTATEAFHPADVLNSRNYDSRIENPDKLGEPMVELRVRLLAGSLSAYYLPFRITPRLPSPSSRLSPLPDDARVGPALWAGRDRQIGDGVVEHQWAVQLSQTIGDADISLHLIQHQDRSQPTQLVDLRDGRVRLLYHFVTQVGGTWQQVIDALVIKVEAAHREFGFPDLDPRYRLIQREQLDQTQVAVGFEYGWSYAGGAEGVLLAEGQAIVTYDDPQAARPELPPFQRDVLLGYRHVFNDVDGSTLQAGLIVDLEDPEEVLAAVQYRRRLSDVWSIDANLRMIHAPAPEQGIAQGLERWHEANELNITLSRYF
ncbi:MAG: hypothetical protein H6705_09905 [Myxococcales bacterium]|nr:hypothetical protein [Myxococcales bacterium]